MATVLDKRAEKFAYDSQSQLTDLVHTDQEGVLDCYTYLYDLTGNKTGITKERRGMESESGVYTYGYGAPVRLSRIQKDGKLQSRYGYDVFGNRTSKEEGIVRTIYRYNTLNRLEMAVGQPGKTARYEYNGLGHQTGWQEGNVT